MSKSALVKIGVPSAQASEMRRARRIRQILDQEDAAIARVHAATVERIREVVNEAPQEDVSANETPATDEQPVA